MAQSGLGLVADIGRTTAKRVIGDEFDDMDVAMGVEELVEDDDPLGVSTMVMLSSGTLTPASSMTSVHSLSKSSSISWPCVYTKLPTWLNKKQFVIIKRKSASKVCNV